MITDEDMSFEAELARAARRIKKAHEAQARFDSAKIELRWVKLQDVLDNLHPALQDVSIDVRADFCAYERYFPGMYSAATRWMKTV